MSGEGWSAKSARQAADALVRTWGLRPADRYQVAGALARMLVDGQEAEIAAGACERLARRVIELEEEVERLRRIFRDVSDLLGSQLVDGDQPRTIGE